MQSIHITVAGYLLGCTIRPLNPKARVYTVQLATGGIFHNVRVCEPANRHTGLNLKFGLLSEFKGGDGGGYI